jgi:flavin reductase (DIM6/NTAB) family NADH-FMN oxidoreductase RutF
MYIDLQSISIPLRQQYLQHAIAPRPICFASTVNLKGEVNLSPFSFFNMFSTTPPIVVFSPSRRVRDNTVKHTLENVLEVPEVVINMVDYDMVHQVSLSSCDFPKGVNEFLKAGFTEEPATRVKPPMVRESKVRMECLVREVKPLGSEPGAGNLVICEVLCMHIADDILGASGMIDQQKAKHVARLGGDWYSLVDSSNLFQVEKPNTRIGIGLDNLPEAIRLSPFLTGNQLGQLANVHELPPIDPAFHDERLTNIILYFSVSPDEMEKELHVYAAQLLQQGKVAEAWQVLLALP